MKKYRISKYNPIFRTEEGIYEKEEWTSYYDIGKIIAGKTLFEEEYLNIEKKYIDTVFKIMKYLNIESLCIMKLENFVLNEELSDSEKKYSTLFKEGKELNFRELEIVIKSILREKIWCGFYSKNIHFILRFGYDYYLNLICSDLEERIIEESRNIGIYIEEI